MLTGGGIAGSTWYVLSREAEQHWKAGDPLGWAGPLDVQYVLIPLVIGLVLVLIGYLLQKHGKSIWYWGSNYAIATTVLGIAFGMLQWYLFSQFLIDDLPRSKSFAFGLPVDLIIAAIVCRCFPVQKTEKWQGLTLGTLGQEILIKKDETCQDQPPKALDQEILIKKDEKN